MKQYLTPPVKHIALILSVCLFLWTCNKDDIFLDEQETTTEALSSKSSLASKKETNKGAKKLKNPYALKNMQKALNNIKKELTTKKIKTKGNNALRLEEGVQDFELSTSHYYVLLSPQNAEQEALIKEDPNIHVFDYPLDYEFTDDYLDNRTVDNDSIPEYYTSVVLGQDLPNGVPYEILEELYIPEEDPFFDDLSINSIPDPQTRQGEIGSGDDLLRHLLMEAFSLTDNQDELLPEGDTTNAFWIFGSKWNPSGNLKLWDDNAGTTTTTTRTFSHYEYYYCDTGDPAPAPGNGGLDPLITRLDYPVEDENICQRAVYTYTSNPPTQGKYVPLEGAQVLMRQWFTIRQGITDANGYFRTGSVRGKARYIIQWERYHYSIRNGSLFQAETRGPKNTSAWNKSIKGGDDEYHGMIHTAAHTYYYGDRLNLTRPPENGLLQRQIKIAARETAPWGIPSSYSHIRSELTFGLAPQIHIKAWGRSSDRVFGTTIHELAHAAHSIIDRGAYDNIVRDAFFGFSSETKNNNRRLLETWPSTVEIALTVNRYKNKFGQIGYEYGNTDGFNFQNLQNRKITDENHYTSAGWDMIDGFNQGDSTPLSGGFGSQYPFDRVSGYTIDQLEYALHGARSWWEWRDNIKSRYDNPTKQYLDELFNNWPN